MRSFAIRNIRLYFRDRASVLFSLLGVFVVVALYVVFLGQNMAQGYSNLVPKADLLINCWLVAGVCAITPVTTAMGAYGTMVDDRARGLSKDFMASPVRRSKLVGGYMAGGLVVALVMSLVVILIGGGWLLANGMALPGASWLLAYLGVQALAALSGASLTFLIVSLFKTLPGYSAASTLVGTVIGFLTGIYLPIGFLPGPVQWLVRIFPATHAAALLRDILLRGPAAEIFAGAPPQVVDEIWQSLGVRLWFGDTIIPQWSSVLYLAGFSLLCFALAVLRFRSMRK